MGNPSNVGRSSRTPVKHMILDRMVGKIAGVLSLGSNRVPCKANPFFAVDLCGGDGTVTDEHDASPQILHKHCCFLRNRGYVSNLTVFETLPMTFNKLKDNTKALSGFGDWFTIENSDSSTFVMPRMKRDQAAFVHCDPNCVDQIPLTTPFVESWNTYTTYLVTLGCNVGGVKRKSLEERMKWFDYISILRGSLPRHHDAILFWLNQDASQWAYLLSIPRVWAAQFSEDVVVNASKWWPRGIGFASMRDQPRSFSDNVNRLFLTEKERADDSSN